MSDQDNTRDTDILPPRDERDTLPPGEMEDPATLLASVAIQLDGVSRALAGIARDLALVMGQSKSHGKTLGVHDDRLAALEADMMELKRTVGDLVGDGR
ncbi:MAG TPA: hypothetical protein VGK73_08760 [Polyangiaceae bacterium]